MTHTSRTKPILSNEELRHIAELIKSKSSAFSRRQVNFLEIGKPNSGGIISGKEKGYVYAFLWDRKIRRGSMSMNFSVINGFEDPLFDNEDYVQIFYEIFPSASENQRDSPIFDSFKKVQKVKKTHNFAQTKTAVLSVIREAMARR